MAVPSPGQRGPSETDVGFLVDSDAFFHADSESDILFDWRCPVAEILAFYTYYMCKIRCPIYRVTTCIFIVCPIYRVTT